MDDMPLTTSPNLIARIPDEIAIFMLDHLGLKPDLIHVSHVSQRWRTLARSHPTFWKSIPLRDEGEYGTTCAYDLAQAQISASNNDGVSIGTHIHRTSRQWKNFPDRSETKQVSKEDEIEHAEIESSALLDFTALLVSNMDRISNIAILATDSAYRLFHIGGLFTTMAPNLDRLEMAMLDDDEGRISSCIFNWSYLDYFAPRLRALRLYDVHVEDAGLIVVSSPHESLEEIAWRLPSDTIGAGPPRLEDVLAQFPSLQSLELFWDSDYEPGPGMQDVSPLLANFKRIALPRIMIRELDLRQLRQVSFIAAEDPLPSTINGLLEHFHVEKDLKPSQKAADKLPRLHIDLGFCDYETGIQRTEIRELIPGGRVRVFDDVTGSFPSDWEIPSLSHRLTKISMPVHDWHKVINRLSDVPALQELLLRFYTENGDSLRFAMTGTLPVLQCPELRVLTLETVGEMETDLQIEELLAFANRAIDERAHGRMQLGLERVNVYMKVYPDNEEERIWGWVFAEEII